MRTGARLGVDVGDVRIGVAVSDPSGVLATPVETVRAGDRAVARIAALAYEHEVVEVVVGLPRSLSGGLGPAARKVRAYAEILADAVAPIPVRLVDERMSTMTADQTLSAQGKRGKQKRAVIDQAAAVVILQSALDTERTSGSAPGDTVSGRGDL
ncbi:MAG: Holliday junction resolvase RuvX [Nocardioidaceae bacterium]